MSIQQYSNVAVSGSAPTPTPENEVQHLHERAAAIERVIAEELRERIRLLENILGLQLSRPTTPFWERK